MAIYIGIINGKAPSAGVGGVSDADFSNLAVNFLTPGAVGDSDLQVLPQTTANNTVKVKTGKLYAKTPSGGMVYHVNNNADYSPITITNNPSGNPLIGSVYLKIDTVVTPDNLASNVATFGYLAGTPAASPVAPTDAELQTAVGSGNVVVRLADISVVAGFTSAMAIDASMITDKRVVAGFSTASITDGSVTTAKLATNAVTNASIHSFGAGAASVIGANGSGIWPGCSPSSRSVTTTGGNLLISFTFNGLSLSAGNGYIGFVVDNVAYESGNTTNSTATTAMSGCIYLSLPAGTHTFTPYGRNSGSGNFTWAQFNGCEMTVLELKR